MPVTSTARIVLLCLILGACGSPPRYAGTIRGPAPPDLPESVDEDAARECQSRAEDAAAAARGGRVSNIAGVLFGALGAMVQIARARHKQEKADAAYNKTLAECLREKGQAVATPR